MLPTIKTSHSENFNKQQTHRPILPIRDDKACLCHKQDGKLLHVL